jgi:hypothetical protein
MIRLTQVAFGIAVAFTVEFPLSAWAADDGIATRGATGGLTIPSASVLNPGEVAVSAGNFEEPQIGLHPQRRTYSVGVGLVPNVELFYRLADYQDPLPGTNFINGGPRDKSVNLKLQLPVFARWQPNLAVGVTDAGGGASFFRSAYGVASSRIGFVDWRLGYALGRTGSNGQKTFNGLFGGVELHAGSTGLSALAEYDGQQKYAGLRYHSPGLEWLGGTEFVVSAQRSFGARSAAGRDVDSTSLNLSAIVPLEHIAQKLRTFKPEHSLRGLDAAAGGIVASTEDRLGLIRKALVAAGLERVRTGTKDADLVVEYENQIYGQTEADALGVVLGVAAELAPPGTQRVRAIVLKAGLPVYETSVAVAAFRSFLREGDSGFVSGSLALDRDTTPASEVKWGDPVPDRRALVHLQLEPDATYAIGTDVGVFEYSLAANLRAFVPLWKGAELYTSYIERIANSEQYDPINVFGRFRHRNGLRVAALQQSFWLGHTALVTVGAGRYNYDQMGAQLESSVFIPGRDDVIRLKAGAYERLPGQTRSQATPLSGTYRWVYSPSTWVEAGFQQYTDGSRGPSIELTRWFGIVGAHLFYRAGGSGRHYAGLEFTIPLTPRKGAQIGPVTLNGAHDFTRGERTRLAVGSTTTNFFQPSAVLDFPLDYRAESRMLDSGRATQRYFITQLHRMREAFYLYARDRLPE